MLFGAAPAWAGEASVRPGDIIVANPNSTDALVKVDPATGQESVFSSNAVSQKDFFQDSAYDLVLDPRGTLYVIDFTVPGVVAVDLKTGEQLRLVTQGDRLQEPLGLDRDPDGSLVVADSAGTDDPGNESACSPGRASSA
jgi:hypothetical protein